MTLGVGGLAGYALAVEPEQRRERLDPADLGTGLGSAAALYLLFVIGDRLARRIMPAGGREIGDVYALRRVAPRPAIATALALVIGPGEELFWRGLVQRNLQRRWGRRRGWLLTSGAYGAIHLVSQNLTLTGAATTAGLFWGGLYAWRPRLAPLVISHAAWDVFIFLVAPTG